MNQGGPGHNPLHDLWENDQEVYQNGRYLTELISERAVGFIRQAAGAAAPFLLYVAYNAPHYPMHAPQEYLDRFPGLPWDRRIMAAMLAAMDDGVGAIVAELERQGIRDNTIVCFQSDNGPSRETRNWLDGRRDPYYGGGAGALKGHKFSLYEGGIRVPAIVSWPARIPAGQVIREVGAAIDFFPTLLAAAGGDPSAYELDGSDITATLAEGAPSPHGDLFWELEQQTALRRGPWKLVLNGRLVEGEPPEDAVFLANLDDDVGERRNLNQQQPALAAELTAAANEWRARLERRWRQEWQPHTNGTTTHGS
jgi:arylsulfatase A-like enzyme